MGFTAVDPKAGMSRQTLLLLVCITCSIAAETPAISKKQPKLFYVSTQSTTSTVLTQTLCYVTSNSFTTTACSGRRKRHIQDHVDAELETIDMHTIHQLQLHRHQQLRLPHLHALGVPLLTVRQIDRKDRKIIFYVLARIV